MTSFSSSNVYVKNLSRMVKLKLAFLTENNASFFETSNSQGRASVQIDIAKIALMIWPLIFVYRFITRNVNISLLCNNNTCKSSLIQKEELVSQKWKIYECTIRRYEICRIGQHNDNLLYIVHLYNGTFAHFKFAILQQYTFQYLEWTMLKSIPFRINEKYGEILEIST